jgi:uncharacterized protein YbjT (DUF2867 family)
VSEDKDAGPPSSPRGDAPPRTVLLTGATGFVGRAVLPALAAAGWRVRCLTRDAKRARLRLQGLDWVEGDVRDEPSCRRAIAGCQAALYLVHSMGERGREGETFADREVASAQTFARAAAEEHLARIVYLGGLAPAGHPSSHLRSRLAVGEALRAGVVPALELRASMIIGQGSLSWLIVRDLAARLPVMVLPSWLRSRTQPIAIDDIVAALVATLELSPRSSTSYDVPGPDIMSCREILEATARVLELPAPISLELPVLTPHLSSHWVRFVTRARWAVAREVVVGLTHDLLARDDAFWRMIGHTSLIPFGEAARRALAAEAQEGPIAGVWGQVERLRRTRHGRRHHSAAE